MRAGYPSERLLIEAKLGNFALGVHITVTSALAGNFQIERCSGFLQILKSHAAVVEAFLQGSTDSDMQVGHGYALELGHQLVFADFTEASQGGIYLGISKGRVNGASKQQSRHAKGKSVFHVCISNVRWCLVGQILKAEEPYLKPRIFGTAEICSFTPGYGVHPPSIILPLQRLIRSASLQTKKIIGLGDAQSPDHNIPGPPEA